MKNLLKQIHEGYWFYPVTDFVYDEEYINKYKKYEKTELGKIILNIRLDTLRQYEHILDIGVGSGQLINNKPNSMGYDVNPLMIKQLKDNNKFHDPYTESIDEFDALCFFDSFEHIEKPEELLKKVTHQDIIMAIPIFVDYEELLKSKHFRPDEHFHYFTTYGLLKYMKELNFKYESAHAREIWVGRQGIFTYTFKRAK